MVKSPIKVFVRTRPVTNNSCKNLFINEEEGWISLNLPKNQARGHINHQIENWGFRFDGILSNSPQEEVFDIIAKDTIQSALEGYSGTIFCYGQTGAGKTFTMSGSTSSYKHRGIIPRAISAMFQEVQARSNEHIEIKVSYLEIYNETMYDLLSINQDAAITINEDGKGGIVVKGLSQILCEKEEEALSLFFEGEINRTTTQHNQNKNSSRSHSIFTMYIESKSKIGSTKRRSYSKINLVDLAGSERTKKTGSEGQTLIEANYINKSLSFLQQVVCALSEKHRDHVPYRQSKLTNILKDSIGGNCKTTMIANIWPEASNLEETISTLKFATRMKQVSNEPIPNVFVDCMSPQKFGRDSTKFFDQGEPLTLEEQEEIKGIAKQYVNGELQEIEIKSYGQAVELFKQFRELYRNLFDATKGFFHLISADKLKEIGVDVPVTPQKVDKKRKQRDGEDSRSGYSPNSYMGETDPDEDRELDQKLIKGLTGIIRQQIRAKRAANLDQKEDEPRTSNFEADQEQELAQEEDTFYRDTEQEYDYARDINEIKERFKVHTEKINELKSTILSADNNIKKAKSLVTEKIDEMLQPERSNFKQSPKVDFRDENLINPIQYKPYEKTGLVSRTKDEKFH